MQTVPAQIIPCYIVEELPSKLYLRCSNGQLPHVRGTDADELMSICSYSLQLQGLTLESL